MEIKKREKKALIVELIKGERSGVVKSFDRKGRLKILHSKYLGK